jgi:general secretion pathway protein I
LSRTTNPKAEADAGFTLVEALAALAVMAISIGAIGQLSNSSLRSQLYVERHLAQIETARKILAGLPSRHDLGEGSLTGTLDNHQWRIDATPFPNALTTQNAANVWTPEQLALRVLAPTGATIEIDTIRLRKRTGP